MFICYIIFCLGYFLQGVNSKMHTQYTYTCTNKCIKNGTSHYAGSHYLKIHSERSRQIER